MAESRGERTRAAVVAAARRHFASDGWEGATGARIAADVGVTEPTIQHHFGSKSGLLAAVIRQYYDDLLQRMQEVLDEPSEPIARFEGFAVWWLEHNAENIALLAVFGRQGRGSADDEVVLTLRESNRRVTRAFERLIGELKHAGLVRSEVSNRIVRDAFFGAAEHTMTGRHATGRPADLARAARDIVDLLLVGMRPANPAPAEGSLHRVEQKVDEVLARLETSSTSRGPA